MVWTAHFCPMGRKAVKESESLILAGKLKSWDIFILFYFSRTFSKLQDIFLQIFFFLCLYKEFLFMNINNIKS